MCCIQKGAEAKALEKKRVLKERGENRVAAATGDRIHQCHHFWIHPFRSCHILIPLPPCPVFALSPSPLPQQVLLGPLMQTGTLQLSHQCSGSVLFGTLPEPVLWPFLAITTSIMHIPLAARPNWTIRSLWRTSGHIYI